MTTIKQTTITKDVINKKLNVVREFDAPLEKLWMAWTDETILDLWWAPKPWKAVTKTMDFREGGVWLYSMVGPDGTESFCRADFQTIVPKKSFASIDVFCDANGKPNPDFPVMNWKVEFARIDSGTKILVEIRYNSEADMQTIIDMGFEAGFTMGLGNLEEWLAGN